MSSYDADPDVQLMLRFQRGDAAAFDALVRKHQHAVVNLTCRYVKDPGAADDMAQDVFVRVHNARATYRPEAKFTTWLYRIATNLCLNEIRDREKYRPVPLSDRKRPGGEEDGPPGALLDAGAAAPPSEKLERAELRQAVIDAVRALPPQQRMAVLLLRWHGCSYEEIADALDTTVKAVKSLLSRAKENLRQRLGRHLGPG